MVKQLFKDIIMPFLIFLLHLFPSVAVSFRQSCYKLYHKQWVLRKDSACLRWMILLRVTQDLNLSAIAWLVSLHVYSSQAESILNNVQMISQIWKKKKTRNKHN